MKDFFQKIWFYRDLSFLFYLLQKAHQIACLSQKNKDEELFFILSPKKTSGDKRIDNPTKWDFLNVKSAKASQDKERVLRYVYLCFRIRRFFHLYDGCLTRSVLLGHALQKAGFDAKVNFGVEKDKPFEKGHCWVEGLEAETNNSYHLIFQYPR